MSGPAVFGIFIAVLVIAGLVWATRTWRRASPGGRESRVARLRREYERLSGLSPGEAYDSLERHLEAQMKKRPGQSMEFYLESVIRELKRDKR